MRTGLPTRPGVSTGADDNERRQNDRLTYKERSDGEKTRCRPKDDAVCIMDDVERVNNPVQGQRAKSEQNGQAPVRMNIERIVKNGRMHVQNKFDFGGGGQTVSG